MIFAITLSAEGSEGLKNEVTSLHLVLDCIALSYTSRVTRSFHYYYVSNT